LSLAPERGATRVVMHSVAFHYFAETTQRRVAAHIEAAGSAARADAPLAWLRYEQQPGDAHFSLRLRTWPGEDRLLARTHPHGRSVTWIANEQA
jgi:hypothetical protein